MAFDDKLHTDGDAPETGGVESAAQAPAQPAASAPAPSVEQAAAQAVARAAAASATPEISSDLANLEDSAAPADAIDSAAQADAAAAARAVAAHDDVLIQAADALLMQTPAPFDEPASGTADASDAAASGAPSASPDAIAPPLYVDAADAVAAMAADVPPVAPVPGKRRHYVLRALGTVVAVLVVAFTVLVVALAISDFDRVQHVPANTTIDGEVDISGLTRDELRQVIEANFSGGQSKRVSINLNGELREIELQNVGEVDADAMIDAAFAPYAVPIVDRMIDHVGEIFGDEQPARSVATTVKPVSEKVRLAVEQIAADYDRDVRDAGWEFNDEQNKPVVVPAQDGRHIDVEATVRAVEKDITNTAETGEVDGVVTTETASSTDAGQAIYVDTSACVLHFYENGVETRTYDCTPGMKGYTTPHGDWTLSYKDPAPTWYNPHSSWSASMPETIAPGASNPLGLRALALSCGGGIFIHGTTNKSQLGTRASHGCIRLSNDNIVELYDIVETGIPIYVR